MYAANVFGTIELMAYQVLLPGHNKIGMIAVDKLDPNDVYLKPPEGIVLCSRQNEEGSAPGIFLSCIQFTPAIMGLLMSDLSNLGMQILCSEEEGEEHLVISVKIAPRVKKSKDDIFVKVAFKATKESVDRFMQMAEEKNKIYLTFKTGSYLFFFQGNKQSGLLTDREFELYI